MLTARLAASLAGRRLGALLHEQHAACSAVYNSLENVQKQAVYVWSPASSLSLRLWSSAAAESSIAQKLQEAGKSKDLSAVMRVIESAGEEFDTSAVEAALMQVERCTQDMSAEEKRSKVFKSKTFQMLSDMAVSTAADAPPEALARTLGVCGRLGCDEMVLDSLARHLMSGVDKLKPDQMQQLVEGLSQADHSPGVLLLDAIQERLQGLGSDVQQQVMDDIQRMLKNLGRDEAHQGVDAPNPQRQEQPDRIKYT